MTRVSPTDRGLGARASLLRPPGALPRGEFEEKCLGCGNCIFVCPARALAADKNAQPYLESLKSCMKCGLCADVCSHTVIGFTERTHAGFEIMLVVERLADHW